MPSQAPFITLSPHRLDVAQRLADACSHLRVREAWYELQHVRVQLPISANGLRPWAIAFVAWFDFLLTVGWGSVFSLRFPSNYCDEWSTSCPHRKVSFPDSELLDFPWAEINWPWSCMKWKLFDAFCIFPNLGSTNNGIQWLEIIWYLQLLNAGPLCYATICNPRLFFISSQAKVLKSDLASEFDVECYCQTAWRKIQTVQFKKEIQTICQFCWFNSNHSYRCAEKLPGPWWHLITLASSHGWWCNQETLSPKKISSCKHSQFHPWVCWLFRFG